MPAEISYKTLQILIQYMYSGETTVTQDQLDGVLRAGDILRVRGLWRNMTIDSKKENLQSNHQRSQTEKKNDKRDLSHTPGQVQKIRLTQPPSEKKNDSHAEEATVSSPLPASSPFQGIHQLPAKTYERKISDKTPTSLNKSSTVTDQAKKSNEVSHSPAEQSKNKENVEVNNKKRSCSDAESVKSKSDTVENVRFSTFFENCI